MSYSSDDSSESDNEMEHIKSRPMGPSPPKRHMIDTIYTSNNQRRIITRKETNEKVPELPDEIIKAIAQSDPVAFVQLSKTSKKWKAEYNKERDIFYNWLLNNKNVVDVSKLMSDNLVQISTKEQLFQAQTVVITISDSTHVPTNWDFLPNVSKLHVVDHTYKNFKILPLLPKNITNLYIEAVLSDIDSFKYLKYLKSVRMFDTNVKNYVFPPNIEEFTVIFHDDSNTKFTVPKFPPSLLSFNFESASIGIDI